MLIYVASSLNNIVRAKEIIEHLTGLGHTITYDWTIHGRIYDQDLLKQIALLELEGVRNCETILVVLPGESGTHFEFGLAYSLNKNVILLEEAEVKQSSFYHLPGIYKVDRLSRAVQVINSLGNR